jgi:FkbM family methyltransferase
MKLHLFHFSPHGVVRAYSHLKAGRRLCKSTGLKLRPLIPESVGCMTAAYNVYQTLRRASLPSPETIIDVGANVSQMSRLLLGMNTSAKVISFEPNPKLTPIGDVRRIALSDVDGETEFFIPHDDSLWGTIEPGQRKIPGDTTHYSVKACRMDTLIATEQVPWHTLRRPIMVKIDTEGSEKRVIDGFGGYLSDVAYLLAEVENIEQRGENYNLLSLSAILASLGFDQCKIVYACYDGPDAPAYSDILFWRK